MDVPDVCGFNGSAVGLYLLMTDLHSFSIVVMDGSRFLDGPSEQLRTLEFGGRW